VRAFANHWSSDVQMKLRSDAASPPRDTPRYVDGLLAPEDGSVPVLFDAFAAPDAVSPGGCGYSIEAGTFICGGTDPTPADCTGGCCGVCDPFGTDQVCCDPSTGTITIYRYRSGDCPLDVTMACPRTE
jgi:hypothetical protein